MDAPVTERGGLAAASCVDSSGGEVLRFVKAALKRAPIAYFATTRRSQRGLAKECRQLAGKRSLERAQTICSALGAY